MFDKSDLTSTSDGSKVNDAARPVFSSIWFWLFVIRQGFQLWLGIQQKKFILAPALPSLNIMVLKWKYVMKKTAGEREGVDAEHAKLKKKLWKIFFRKLFKKFFLLTSNTAAWAVGQRSRRRLWVVFSEARSMWSAVGACSTANQKPGVKETAWEKM